MDTVKLFSDNSILYRISQIEYKPNDIDEERFLLYMIDGNYVYISLFII